MKKSFVLLIALCLSYLIVSYVVDIPSYLIPNDPPAKIDNSTGVVFLGLSSNQIGTYKIQAYEMSTGRVFTVDASDDLLTTPAIDGDKMAYVKYLNGSSDIFLYDFSAGQTTRLTYDAYEQSNPRISGDVVVWEDDRSNYLQGSRVTNLLDVYMYDIATKKTAPLIVTQLKEIRPAISGDNIALEIYSGGIYERLFIYNIPSNMLTEFAVSPSLIGYPDIYENWVVWTSVPEGGDLFLYETTKKSTTTLTKTPENEMDARINDDRIVYAKGYIEKDLDIYLFDLSTGAQKRITETPNNVERTPVVAGDFIAYVRLEGDHSNLYLYDIESKTEKKISSGSDYNYVPAISDKWIAWVSLEVSD